MKSFRQFFLEYRHNYADGTPSQSIQVHNGKNINNLNPNKKITTDLPYQKNAKLNIDGALLNTLELQNLGFVNFKEGDLFSNYKNSGSDIQISTSPNGQLVGRVIKIK